MPGSTGLSFLPYADDLPGQTELAHRRGHELLVHVPMEPLGTGNNPGPNALTISLGSDELVGRLRRDLTRFDGFVGINNHMGSKFTSFGPGMALVMAELRSRGLLWLDSRTTGGSVGNSGNGGSSTGGSSGTTGGSFERQVRPRKPRARTRIAHARRRPRK